MFLKPAQTDTEIAVWDIRPSYLMTVLGLRPDTVKDSEERCSEVYKDLNENFKSHNWKLQIILKF